MRIPKEARCVFQGILFDVYQWEQELFDGSKTTYEIVVRCPAASVICTIEDRILILMQEQPNRPLYPSLVAGKIEVNERPEITVQRELLEETGYQFKKLRLIDEFFGGTKLLFHEYLYVAQDCFKVTEQRLESGEKIRLGLITFDEFLQFCRNRNFAAPMGFKFQMYEALIDQQKKKRLKDKIFFA
jgi:ADP-ribose pyrophosphatase